MNVRRERLLTQLLIAERNPDADKRKKRFADIATFIAERGGWVTSVPGAHAIWFDTLPGSALPDQLRELGHDVVKTGTTERILPHAISTAVTLTSSGAFEPATENSTKPVTMRVTNAGIAIVEQFDLLLP